MPTPSLFQTLPSHPKTLPPHPQAGSLEFKTAREALISPLAKRLFTIDGVTAVFAGSDFITVTKGDDAMWAVLKPDVFAAIMDWYAAGEPLVTDAASYAAQDTAIHPDDDEVSGVVCGGPCWKFKSHCTKEEGESCRERT